MSAIASSRNSPWLARLVAVALGVSFALVAGEVLFRILGAPEIGPIRRGRLQVSANPRLAFEPVPGFRASATDDFEEYLGSGNRLGYRDRDHAEARPQGTLRIVVLGDSIAAGYGIARFEETFPALLEQRLREAGLAVEVLNFGVTGYNTEQEVETLRERALIFAPDIVLVAYCHNDREPPDARLIQALREANRVNRAVPESEGRRLLIKSSLYRFLRYVAFPLRDGRWLIAGQAERDTVEASLRELEGIARKERFQVLLAVFPVMPRFYDPEYAQSHADLKKLSDELSFAHLDLRSAFRTCRTDGSQKMGRDLYHPTAAGHRCAAEAMAAAIERMLRTSAVADETLAGHGAGSEPVARAMAAGARSRFATAWAGAFRGVHGVSRPAEPE